MNDETKLEVIKALAYGEGLETIANMAEVDVEEIEQIQKECADEIRKRREKLEEAVGNGN